MENPSPGDKVFVAAVDAQGVEPGITHFEGTIESIFFDTQAGDRALRLKTSIAYRWTYSGASVMNEHKQVIGIVGESDENVVIIPSTYLVDAATHTRVKIRIARR